MKLRVWVNDRPVGTLARHGVAGTTFAYDPGVDPRDAISLSMPVRTASYNKDYGLLPIFDTNLPEGILLDNLRRSIAKAKGRSDSMDVLAITGRNQIGRIKVLEEGQEPERRPSVKSIDEVLDHEATADFIDEMISRYSIRSGVSGAMPKVLVEEGEECPAHRVTLQTRDWIVKFDANDYPGLSLNEYHCLEVARKAGNDTAECALSPHGKSLAVRRFDQIDDERVGFEDFASLNAKTSDEKYAGGIERDVMKRLSTIKGPDTQSNLERAYRLIVTNIALRNGDAHLKNFALLFEDAREGPFTLSPAYDIVTTKAYIQNDMMAMTLGGTKRWPKPNALQKLGARANLTPAKSKEIMEDVGRAIASSLPGMLKDFKDRGLEEIGQKIADCWNEGLVQSLGMDPVDLAVEDPFASKDPEQKVEVDGATI